MFMRSVRIVGMVRASDKERCFRPSGKQPRDARVAPTGSVEEIPSGMPLTTRRAISGIGPEGLVLASAVLLAFWSGPEYAAAEPIRMAPYAVGLGGLLLGWRLRRSRLVFALVALGPAFALVTAWMPQDPTVFQLVAILLPLDLAAIALLPERGVLTPSGGWQGAALLLEIAAAAVIVRHAGRGPVWPPLAHAFVPPALTGWTRLDQPALLAFLVSVLAVGAGRWLRRDATGRGYLWALAAVFLALHTRDAGLDRVLFFAAAGAVLLVAVIELSYVLAYHDGLTGLPGRRALKEALDRVGGAYAFAMADVDHFKRFNDTYGHEVGDEVLRTVGARLKEALPEAEVFRYGGEEFAILFPPRSAERCLPMLEAARAAVASGEFTVRRRLRPRKKPAKPKTRRGQARERITVSLGLAHADRRHSSAEEVIAAADRALYRAKEKGRNRVES
jgi:diguanylate cyclase (GGDEF)-like protein